jgi:hypothetical protein
MIKKLLAIAGLSFAALSASITANAALVTSDESAGHPLPSGSVYIFDETIGASTTFAHSIHFSTDGSAGSGSAASVGLELDGVSSFIGDFTISLYEGIFSTGADTSGGTLVASTTGTNLSNVAIQINTNYSFIIEGLTGSTPTNVLTGSVGISPIPVPAAAWLFGSALLGLAGMKRRK